MTKKMRIICAPHSLVDLHAENAGDRAHAHLSDDQSGDRRDQVVELFALVRRMDPRPDREVTPVFEKT